MLSVWNDTSSEFTWRWCYERRALQSCSNFKWKCYIWVGRGERNSNLNRVVKSSTKINSPKLYFFTRISWMTHDRSLGSRFQNARGSRHHHFYRRLKNATHLFCITSWSSPFPSDIRKNRKINFHFLRSKESSHTFRCTLPNRRVLHAFCYVSTGVYLLQRYF